MANVEDIGKRVLELEKGLTATRGSNNMYNGRLEKTSIKKLQMHAKEASKCLKGYPVYDNGGVSLQFSMLSDQRRMHGLPSDPPTQMKVLAWNMVKIVKMTLVEAHEEIKNEEASEIYESLIDHCLKARVEIWEGESELHSIMSNFALCMKIVCQ